MSNKCFYEYLSFLSQVNLLYEIRSEVKLVKDYNANGEIRNTLPTIFEHIDIFHDRFSNGNHGGKEHVSSVKKEAFSRKIIQKEILFKSSQVNI